MCQLTAWREFLGYDAERENQKEPVGSLVEERELRNCGEQSTEEKKATQGGDLTNYRNQKKPQRPRKNHQIDQAEPYRKITQSQEYHLR